MKRNRRSAALWTLQKDLLAGAKGPLSLIKLEVVSSLHDNDAKKGLSAVVAGVG
jgi:hypothetical protein